MLIGFQLDDQILNSKSFHVSLNILFGRNVYYYLFIYKSINRKILIKPNTYEFPVPENYIQSLT